VEYPRVQSGTNLVEAFPRAFVAVMLRDEEFAEDPGAVRSPAWLHDRCLSTGAWDRLRLNLPWHDHGLWTALYSDQHYEEERAALIAVLAAVAVHVGRYVAVGEPQGGYIFLPPWNLWQPWAKAGLDRNRSSLRLPNQVDVDVWINGRRFKPYVSLPGEE
jgi:hypothetical protein